MLFEGGDIGETCVKTPPSKGPATDAIPHMVLIIPNAAGLFLSGTVQVSNACSKCALGEDSQQYDKMTKEPEKRPPTPAPAMALPTIKALLVGAVAQIKELHNNE